MKHNLDSLEDDIEMEIIDSSDSNLLHSTSESDKCGNSHSHSFSVHSFLRNSRAQGLLIGLIIFGIPLIVISSLYIPSYDSSGYISFKESEITLYNASVVSDDKRCSDIGVKMLEMGGNAMDAIIATSFCIGVLVQASAGLGGGGFIMGHFFDGSHVFIDSRETAPMASSWDYFVDNEEEQQSGLYSIATPALLKGLYEAWSSHGQLDWSDLVAPSIELAEESSISPFMAKVIKYSAEYVLNDAGLRGVYSLDGNLLQEGDLSRNSALANTLTEISKIGASAIYGDSESVIGPIGRLILDDLKSKFDVNPLPINETDILNYQALYRNPIVSDIFGHTFILSPLPSSGGIVSQAVLRLLEMDKRPVASISDSLYYHRFIEALKHGFALRMNLGDGDYFSNETELNLMLNEMQSIEFLTDLFNTISDDTVQSLTEYGGKYNQVKESDIPNDAGTSHLSAMDQYGNAVSMTMTVNGYFGSKFLSPSTGLVLNNEMADFSSPNTSDIFGLSDFESNYISPGKRPLSSMNPMIVLSSDGNPRLVLGGSGGPIIISASLQVCINVLIKGMSVTDAIEAPRLHSQLLPDTVTYEVTKSMDGGTEIVFDESVVQQLRNKGHEMLSSGGALAITNSMHVQFESNKIDAVGDLRKGGGASGYL